MACPDTLAPSHSSLAIRESGAVVADAKYRKRQKYVQLGWRFLACLEGEARSLFKEIGRAF